MPRNRWPAELVVEALQREDVRAMFGIFGGHIASIQDYAYRAGIDVLQVRHEQAAVHAADGYARMARGPGVCFATAGPGMTNTVTAMHMAYVNRSPVVLLLGGHKVREEGRATMQEADAGSVLGSVTKSFRRVTVPEQADLFVRMAFREAMTYPYGPVAIEFPTDLFNDRPIPPETRIGWPGADVHLGRPPAVAGDPAGLAAAFESLSAAERPLIIAGDGVHWDDAGDELRQLVETLSVPLSMRRHGRGAVPERHPLVIPAPARKRALADADVVMLLGLHLSYLEGFGDWNTSARFIQVNRHPSEASVSLPTLVEITADHRTFLRRMNALALDLPADRSRPSRTWSDACRGEVEQWRERRDAGVREVAGREIIHPLALASELSRLLPSDVPIILDSFTASGFLAEFLQPETSGSVMDAGLSAAFGHGVGMAVGASMASDAGPVVSVLGDGGVGLGGGDIETAVRYDLPVVFIVSNNGALGSGMEDFAYGPEYSILGAKARRGFNLTPDVRYDEMFAPLGCHTEHVTRLDELEGALERSLRSGRPSVVNVVVDRNAQPGLYETVHAREMFWHLPADEVMAPARRRHHETLFPRFHGGLTLAEAFEAEEGPSS
ncbi:thiamine pyrophosphate-binding protein [Streptomyces sp. SRF1]|uniref:thiamine pyrophosphate-binding protein n=1 Tax=Streptomyces sp. SRF1 TaxID=1549642 RepID=UPI0025AF4DC8|nr:thiamine pyrophosphate-binding protein [Streptomyces sp. SRF1]MDN3059781.1 thiamine pyrophosphate-binding protein [Streptomyces sp. SRF1]